MNDVENNQNKVHIKKVYMDKTGTLLKIGMAIMIISLLTYLIPLFLFENFDFGLIFEIISFIFIVIAYNNIGQNNINFLKRNVIIAMIPIGWLIIYDIIELIVNLGEVLVEVIKYYFSWDRFFFYIEPYLYDVILVATIIILYKAYKSLSKVEGNEEDNNYTDTFYDSLEQKWGYIILILYNLFFS